MTWKAKRFERHLASEIGEQKARKFVKSCGAEPKSPVAKAKYIRGLMERFENEFPRGTRERVLQACGRECICASWVVKARKIYEESRDMKDFLARLNKIHLGGGHLELKGGKVTGYYAQCYCSSVNKTRDIWSPTYCNCSQGWLRELFEGATGKRASVKFKTTVIQGGERCEFEVALC